MTVRVMHVVGRMDRGGAETMIMNQFRKINRAEIQFDFIVHNQEKNDYSQEINDLGGRIYTVPKFNGFNLISYIKAWNKILSKLNNKSDIIHGHMGSSAAIYLGLAKRKGFYTIAHSHNTNSKIKDIKSLVYRILSFPVRYIAHYFFACGRQAGLDRYGKDIYNSSIFKVVNNAIDTEEFLFDKYMRRDIRRELNIEDKFVIGHVGRFDYQKNHDFIIDIFKDLYSKNNNAVLLLVGDGNLKEKMMKKVSMLGLEKSVIFTGVRSDVNKIMQAMDIFLFPSHYEGLPVTIIEAQASGLKCILSDVITKEVDITGNVDYISLNSTVDEWSNAILKYKDKYKRQNMYKQICDSGYDINNTVSWIENFYIEKLQKHVHK